ncbi:hypothetical protein ACFMPD_05715 [Sedimentitalea sp. HM32M-2]|uniref:hypothetical protein n=1 Tax=Sedimentitalea sp. HM32M-2 TaxID=3351566 RepID=UPI0036418311
MRCIVIALLFCAVCAPPALAGAWLREQKTAFTALGATVRGHDQGIDYETRFYLEYGLRPRVTLGLDFNEIPGKAGHALVFARLPLGRPDRRTRLALELGLGGHHWQRDWAAMYKIALAAGRGFESRLGNGWMGVETAVERRTGLSDPAFKLDTVVGLSSGFRFRPLIKLETAYMRGQPFSWALKPGVMFDLAGSTWVVGLERRSAAQDTLGVTFGLWRNF